MKDPIVASKYRILNLKSLLYTVYLKNPGRSCFIKLTCCCTVNQLNVPQANNRPHPVATRIIFMVIFSRLLAAVLFSKGHLDLRRLLSHRQRKRAVWPSE